MPPVELSIPDTVLTIAQRLTDAGHDTWCVGGAIRDNLLGQDNKDFDLATAATPDEVQQLFKRTVPVGVEHGTVGVLDKHGGLHEVTTFRKDVKTDGRHAVVEFGASLEDDLARRDFTINAIAYHPVTHEWLDPFEGRMDLERRLVRAVGDPAQRFREDYLRILRALRFAARFGFEIDSATWTAARELVSGLEHLSAERVRDEWFKGIGTAGFVGQLVGLWWDVGAMGVWMREVGRARCTVHGAGGTEDERTAHSAQRTEDERTAHSAQRTVDRLPGRDPVLVTSYLSDDPVATLTRLKCSRAEIERGRGIAVHRDTAPDPSDAESVRRWMSAAGPVVDDVVAIAVAEGQGDELARAVRAVRASGAPLTLKELAVTGNDLMAAGVHEGPQLGATLRALLDAVLQDPQLNASEELIRLARDPDFIESRITNHASRPNHAKGGEEGSGP